MRARTPAELKAETDDTFSVITTLDPMIKVTVKTPFVVTNGPTSGTPFWVIVNSMPDGRVHRAASGMSPAATC